MDMVNHVNIDVNMFDQQICLDKVKLGDLEYLKHAHNSGLQWAENVCAEAAANGNLECLEYAHENGCPWDEMTCQYASARGLSKCLKYAFLLDAPWPDAPIKMIEWRERIRHTAKLIMDKWRFDRRNRAAKIIQYALLPIIHRPGGPLMTRQMNEFLKEEIGSV
jgi:hypothetical protein